MNHASFRLKTQSKFCFSLFLREVHLSLIISKWNYQYQITVHRLIALVMWVERPKNDLKRMLDRTGTIKKTGALCKFSIFKDNFIMMLLYRAVKHCKLLNLKKNYFKKSLNQQIQLPQMSAIIIVKTAYRYSRTFSLRTILIDQN